MSKSEQQKQNDLNDERLEHLCERFVRFRAAQRTRGAKLHASKSEIASLSRLTAKIRSELVEFFQE